MALALPLFPKLFPSVKGLDEAIANYVGIIDEKVAVVIVTVFFPRLACRDDAGYNFPQEEYGVYTIKTVGGERQIEGSHLERGTSKSIIDLSIHAAKICAVGSADHPEAPVYRFREYLNITLAGRPI